MSQCVSVCVSVSLSVSWCVSCSCSCFCGSSPWAKMATLGQNCYGGMSYKKVVRNMWKKVRSFRADRDPEIREKRDIRKFRTFENSGHSKLGTFENSGHSKIGDIRTFGTFKNSGHSKIPDIRKFEAFENLESLRKSGHSKNSWVPRKSWTTGKHDVPKKLDIWEIGLYPEILENMTFGQKAHACTYMFGTKAPNITRAAKYVKPLADGTSESISQKRPTSQEQQNMKYHCRT